MFGSIGFVVALTLSGLVYDRVGMMAFVPILLLGNILRLWLSIELPIVGRRNPSKVMKVTGVDASAQSSDFYQLGIVLTIVASGVIHSSHAVFNTFCLLYTSPSPRDRG